MSVYFVKYAHIRNDWNKVTDPYFVLHQFLYDERLTTFSELTTFSISFTLSTDCIWSILTNNVKRQIWPRA
jgi:hypothetical protein